MPELPEVETARLSFTDRLEGATVQSVRLGAPLRWPLGVTPRRLVGLCAGATTRRGKYLWVPLSRADRAESPEGGLLMHLGMSGSLAWWPGANAPAPAKHDHFDLVTSHGTLRLTDPRRFGAVLWSRALDVAPAASLLAKLGAEPFDAKLTERAFHAALKRRRAPIKSVLLAGDIVVGAGNIYACEALFDAAIDPRLRADRVSAPRAARLLGSIRATLTRALALGGSTLRDFRDAHGMDGTFQAEARVYGRAGAPCTRCGAALRRIVQSQRATYFCAACQRR